MKNKALIISGLVVLVIGIALIIFLPRNNREKIGQEIFTSFNKISCISVDHSDGEQKNVANAYNNGETVLEGYPYEGGDAKEFVYDLIRNRVINTFMHISADVCLTSYEDNTENIILGYKARQVYYTSGENINIYNFSVEINKVNNNVILKGE